MTKFKVGDKVRITGLSIFDRDEIGKEGVVKRVDVLLYVGGYGLSVIVDGRSRLYRYTDVEHSSPTKNQRITTLESEVAELKAKVEALEKAQLSGPGTVYLHGKPIGKIDAIAALSKSPNEQRKAIIAEAKAFVKKYSGVVRADTTPFTSTSGDTIVKIFVNKDKRIVTAVPHLVHVNTVISSDRRFAKCAPDDVFNADIGKAIALGRALGLDVSRFEQAVKPTEVVVGMNVEYQGYRVEIKPKRTVCMYSKGTAALGSYVANNSVILDDTEAQY